MGMSFNDAIDKVVAGYVNKNLARPPVPREKLANGLERFGFSRAIAGDANFNKALDAIALSRSEGRGLLISGENGVGKTRLMRAIYEMYHLRVVEHPERKENGYTIPARETDIYHQGGEWIDCNVPENLQWLTEDDLLDRSIYLDDYGSERMLYGDVDAVGAFICKWHARHKDWRYFNMTTNLDSEQLNNRSGGRVLDRLCEDCVLVKLEGDSKRKVIKVV